MVDSTIHFEGSPLPLVVDVITFLYKLSTEVAKDSEKEIVQRWCEEAVKHVLDLVWPSKDAQDAKMILQIIKLVGMELSRQS